MTRTRDDPGSGSPGSSTDRHVIDPADDDGTSGVGHRRKGGWVSIIKLVRSRIVGPGVIETKTKEGKEGKPRVVSALLRSALLDRLADFCDEDGSCFPSQDLLAQVLGTDTGAVRRGLLSLEADGIISRERRWRKDAGDGGRLSDLVTLNLDVIAALPGPKTWEERQAERRGGLPRPGPGKGGDGESENGAISEDLPRPGPGVTGPEARGYRALGPRLPRPRYPEGSKGSNQEKEPEEGRGIASPYNPLLVDSTKNDVDHAAHARAIRGVLSTARKPAGAGSLSEAKKTRTEEGAGDQSSDVEPKERHE